MNRFIEMDFQQQQKMPTKCQLIIVFQQNNNEEVFDEKIPFFFSIGQLETNDISKKNRSLGDLLDYDGEKKS